MTSHGKRIPIGETTGVRVAPIEPTRDMIEAAYPLLPIIGSEARARKICIELWKTMIEHAPTERRGGITKRQRRVLEVISEYIDQHGEAPTYREVSQVLDMNDPSGVHRAVGGLVRKGILFRGSGRRGITVLIRPEQI